MSDNGHMWWFFRAGGVDQVLLQTADDIANLDRLDPKLWVALACPASGIDFDPRTLAHVDCNGDGRIRIPEVVEAIKWAEAHLNDLNELFKGGDSVPLWNIKDPLVVQAARRILASCGRPDAAAISLSDLAQAHQAFAALPFNGDGIVPPQSSQDPQVREVVEQIIATVGGIPDLGGDMGIDRGRVESFFSQARALCDWYAQAQADKAILPLGPDRTPQAASALDAVRAKVDDYFTRCRLIEFDPNAAGPLNPQQGHYLAIASKDISDSLDQIAALPLAAPGPSRPLPLSQGLNPAWEAAMARFVALAVEPFLGPGKRVLRAEEWTYLQQVLEPYYAWQRARPQTRVETLRLDRLRSLVGSDAAAKILELIGQDEALRQEAGQFQVLQRLILFQRDLVKLLRNFVNFADFYWSRRGIFQAGTLYMDSRACTLCMEVSDPARHSALAGFSGMFLAYCDCTRPGGHRKGIVAAFTAGDADNIVVGRNGIFYDTSGLDWDATVTKIVANPISIRAAFWSPYRKLVRWIEQQISKWAEAAEAATTQGLTKGLQTAAQVQQPPGGGPGPQAGRRVDVGTVAAIGVALGSIGTALGLFVGKFVELGPWMPLGVVGLILSISGPSMVLAYLKLRRRNLGPLLDASGWAINGWARVNMPLGRKLTQVARLPRGSRRVLADPLADSTRAR